MAAKVFLAGATGAIGKRLAPLLIDAGYAVFGSTRRRSKAAALAEAGVTPVVLDVFDTAILTRALCEIAPEVVIHQLTDLPPGLESALMDEALHRNARVRREGTRNLVDAAIASGAQRLVAQSIAWVYAPGPEPHHEGDPLDMEADGNRAVTIAGVAALENMTLASPQFEGVVLRYGQLYGPGTGFDSPGQGIPVHVDAAAYAALLAIDKIPSGIVNIAEPNVHVSIDKAIRELGWDPAFRLGQK